MFKQVHGEQDVCYVKDTGKSCSTEIQEQLHLIILKDVRFGNQCICSRFIVCSIVVRNGNGRARSNAYIACGIADVGMNIFTRGLCLPSDIKMTAEQQDRTIELIKACFE